MVLRAFFSYVVCSVHVSVSSALLWCSFDTPLNLPVMITIVHVIEFFCILKGTVLKLAYQYTQSSYCVSGTSDGMLGGKLEREEKMGK